MKNKFIASGIFGLAFILLIILVCTYNLAGIGPEGTSIGLSTINGAVHDAFPGSELWYEVSELFGYLAIAVVGVFGIIGVCQAFKRKGLSKVDKKLFALAGLFVLLAAVYLLFEIIVINYRPVIMAGDAHVEASFPSSHTMLVCVIMGGAFVILKDYVKNRGLCVFLQMLCVIVAVATALSRLLSGVHWLTDILGGVIISLAMTTLYSAICDLLEQNK